MRELALMLVISESKLDCASLAVTPTVVTPEFVTDGYVTEPE